MKKLISIFVVLICMTNLCAQEKERIDLSGLWRFQFDPMGFGKTPGSELYLKKLNETIVLPGSTDQSGKGIKNSVAYVDRLSRRYEYSGPAWYQREIVIPEGWDGKEITLLLERCHWETAVYIDDKYIGTDERLSVPNRFDVTRALTPGLHTITICVDNDLKYPMDQWNHGTTEHTQTNWNGIAGKMELIAKERVNIRKVDVYPDIDSKKITAVVKITGYEEAVNGKLTLRVKEAGGDKVVNAVTIPVSVGEEGTVVRQEVAMGKIVKLWDEFSPNLYSLEALLEINDVTDTETVTFGMRKVEQGRHHIRLNDNNIHLRGVLDCAVFPLTGYPSTDPEDWKRIFTTIQSYGMNHVRFHSWCPPKAAFIAADELGMYLQAELPMWIKDVGKYPDRERFFEEEMYAVLNEYGNHPSFILMCNGNENEGDFNVLEDLVKKGQAHDSRRLYSASTARTHVPADQYYTSHVTSKGSISVYEGYPNTMWDKRKESDIDVPVIAHESGQRCMFPNFNEMTKYTGVLEPRNFEVFKERLTRNGMLHQADDFFKATGAHTVLQYKEVNEALLRTPNSGGFQLLGLADFPGQGSAFVGVLDAFWESKGLVTPEKFRESCAPTVLLARFPKRTYTDKEEFRVQLDIYNYSNAPVKNRQVRWELINEQGVASHKGTMAIPVIGTSTVDSLGMISIPLKNITKASKMTFRASITGVTKNEWDIWIYPEDEKADQDGYIYVRNWDEDTKKYLAEGKNVLLIPSEVKGRKTRFASHFWNPIMFRWEPGIVGTLINSVHPVFKDFPTSYYADWQWYDILNYGIALDLNDHRELTPIIQSIDSYEYNRKLGVCFESKVGNGNLFVLCVDPEKDIEKREAMKQLLVSVKNYVASGNFNPVLEMEEYKLDAIFDKKAKDIQNNKNDAATRQLLNQ